MAASGTPMSRALYDWDAGEYLTPEEVHVIDELEAMLRPPSIGLAPYPPKFITLASGEVMVVREASLDEVDTLLEITQRLT